MAATAQHADANTANESMLIKKRDVAIQEWYNTHVPAITNKITTTLAGQYSTVYRSQQPHALIIQATTFEGRQRIVDTAKSWAEFRDIISVSWNTPTTKRQLDSLAQAVFSILKKDGNSPSDPSKRVSTKWPVGLDKPDWSVSYNNKIICRGYKDGHFMRIDTVRSIPTPTPVSAAQLHSAIENAAERMKYPFGLGKMRVVEQIS